MEKLKERITENGIDYILTDDILSLFDTVIKKERY